jgi:hypothetical protein
VDFGGDAVSVAGVLAKGREAPTVSDDNQWSLPARVGLLVQELIEILWFWLAAGQGAA